ncbi:MAG TPA: hypothetical protein VJ689_10515, partial [Gaiellaceae bacterium]|nr:hypothetical protein [Gaiellaceae bacterium]
MAFGRKRDLADSVEEERERLRLQRVELEDLKRELAERVRSVREREEELRAVIANGNGSGATPATLGLLPAPMRQDDDAHAARARELAAREQELTERE